MGVRPEDKLAGHLTRVRTEIAGTRQIASSQPVLWRLLNSTQLHSAKRFVHTKLASQLNAVHLRARRSYASSRLEVGMRT